MKKYLYLALLLSLVSCKPTETNYRKAYETAKERTDRTGIVEGTIYESIRNQGTSGGIVTVSGDTIPLITVAVKPATVIGAPDTMSPYNIALAQFKQRTNAKSMMIRLHTLGYTDATVVMNAEPLYYVIVPGAATVDQAVDLYGNTTVIGDSIMLKPPYPLILQPSGQNK